VDRQGRNPVGGKPLSVVNDEVVTFQHMAQQAQVFFECEKPVLHGRDLLDVVEPGHRMGQLLQQAYHIQLEEGITDKQVLKNESLGKNRVVDSRK